MMAGNYPGRSFASSGHIRRHRAYGLFVVVLAVLVAFVTVAR
jgi:hypothetical protein